MKRLLLLLVIVCPLLALLPALAFVADVDVQRSFVFTESGQEVNSAYYLRMSYGGIVLSNRKVTIERELRGQMFRGWSTKVRYVPIDLSMLSQSLLSFQRPTAMGATMDGAMSSWVVAAPAWLLMLLPLAPPVTWLVIHRRQKHRRGFVVDSIQSA